MFKNKSHYNASHQYIKALVERIQDKHNISQREVSRQIGIGYSTLRDRMTGRKPHSYVEQYALEGLLEADGVKVTMDKDDRSRVGLSI